jgi:3-isopropylmalate dehydrogenase
MQARVVVLPGDGIGPEVIAAAVRVLLRIGEIFGHTFELAERPIGGAAIRAGLPAFPAETLAAVRSADAVLLGAIGHPDFDHLPPAERPEAALLGLRRAMGAFANLRPARVWPGLEDAGPLKPEVLRGTDLVVVRELLGGLYYGQPRGIAADGLSAVNTLPYSREEIERIARVAFALAQSRRRKLVSVDKANVLEVSRLWRDVVTRIGREFPDVTLTHEFVDAAAMKLVLAPSSFDVILTENMFGDILSDEAGAVCGSLGLLPSASLGYGAGLFEPVHGSAPDLAGKDMANPVGAILSVGMLLSDGLRLRAEGDAVSAAVERALGSGARTVDIAAPGQMISGTQAFTDQIVAELSSEELVIREGVKH